jgi:putative membrane protein
MMGFGLLIPLILIGLVALAFGWRPHFNQQPSAQHSNGQQTPLEILKARYARGEISKEEFDQMRKDLNS